MPQLLPDNASESQVTCDHLLVHPLRASRRKTLLPSSGSGTGFQARGDMCDVKQGKSPRRAADHATFPAMKQIDLD